MVRREVLEAVTFLTPLFQDVRQVEEFGENKIFPLAKSEEDLMERQKIINACTGSAVRDALERATARFGRQTVYMAIDRMGLVPS